MADNIDSSDSETEGQLLIDESVGTVKKTRGRKKGSINKNTKKKTTLKLVVKALPTQQKKVVEAEKKTPTATRTSSRVKKRVRKLSPSPEIPKKEPPRKKLKVKIKNLSKERKNLKLTKLKISDNKKVLNLLPPSDNIDIVNVSDEELSSDIQYSSTLILSTEKVKKMTKEKRKSGIKLKLSLGKVLSLNDSIIIEKADDISLEDLESQENTVKPLIISKRQISTEISENEDTFNTSISTNESFGADQNISIISSASGGKSPQYSTSSEDHKPLTLRLSMGKPNTINRSISEYKNFAQSSPKTFPNIRRSWSVTPFKANDLTTDTIANSSPSQSSTSNPVDDDKIKTRTPDIMPSTQNLSTKPFFNAGLQSLLDVVSVEINEQNKTDTGENSADYKSHDTQGISLSTPYMKSQGAKLSIQKQGSSHDGLLPSLAFPKPVLHFSTKKRPRSKSLNKISPQRPLALENSLVEIDHPLVEEIDESTQILSDKEQRRHDKKKKLNSDFVDPDSVVSGIDQDEIKPKKKHVAFNVQRGKTAGGLSLLMPQMETKQSSTVPKLLQTGSACTPQSRNILSKKPRKGMATAKQRLANKLKLGRTSVF